MQKIKDPLILGAVAGLIGNTVKMAGNLINRYVFKFSDTTYPEIAGGIFMSKKNRTKRTGMAVGGLADFAMGAILGVPMVYLLRYTGKDKAALKGLSMGHFVWVFMYGAMGKGFGTKGVFPLDAGTNFSAFLNHSWYGMATAEAIKRLGDPSLFPEPVSRRTDEYSRGRAIEHRISRPGARTQEDFALQSEERLETLQRPLKGVYRKRMTTNSRQYEGDDQIDLYH